MIVDPDEDSIQGILFICFLATVWIPVLSIETEEVLHGWLVKGVFALGVVTYIATTFITAPYARHLRPGWGPTVNTRLGWVLMESPSAIWFAIVYSWGDYRRETTPLIAASMWGCHYVYRSYVYPFLIRTSKNKRMPLTVVLSGDFYNMINAYINARYLSQFGDYSEDNPFTRPSFSFLLRGGRSLRLRFVDEYLLGPVADQPA